MACTNCGRGLHSECLVTDTNIDITLDKCCCKSVDSENVTFSENDGEKKVGVSAGRKRAAVEYKIYPEKECEWKWKANCGGGKLPILGCLSGNQQHRHHGPIKDTTRNEPKNIHLICAVCHNTWHAKNDPIYNEEEFELLPHNPRLMTPKEMMSR